MKNFILILSIVCLCNTSASAISRKAHFYGKITDSNNQPIPDALVVVNQQHTYSLENGYFSLDVPTGQHKVKVICFGYEPKEISLNIDSDTLYNITLTAKSIELSEVQVHGKSKSQRLRESAYSINALDVRSKISELNNLNSLIGRSSGIKVREEGGVGSDFELSINGLSGNAVKYFVDGIPMSTMGSGISLANFPINLIERVEIYKGFVPAELGTDALGGAVNIITKGHLKNYLDVSFGIGSFSTYKGDFTAQYIDKKTKLVIKPTLAINYSKNNYTMKDVEIWDDWEEKFILKNAKRFHDNYKSIFSKIELGVVDKKWADSFFLSASLSNINKELQTGSVQSIVYGMAEKESKSLSLSANYRKKNFILKNLSADISASHTWDHSIVTDTAYRQYRWDGTHITTSRNEIMGRGKSIRHTKRPLTIGRINLNYMLSDQHSFNLNYLVDHVSNDRYDDIDIEFSPSKDLFTKHIVGLSYAQIFWNDKWSNNFFIKDYISHLEINQNDLYWITGANNTPKSTSTNKIGYGLASRFRVTDYFSIKASFEHSVRLPLANEVLGNGTSIFANLKLKPENSDNLNIGLFGNISLNKDHLLNYEIGYFDRGVKDYIRYQASATEDSPGQYENLSNVTVRGFEGELRYSYSNLFQVIANCSYLHTKDKTKYQMNGKPSITYNNHLPNRPWLYTNLELNAKKQNILGKKDDLLKFAYYIQYVHWYYFTWEGYGTLESKSTIPTQFIQNAALTYSLENEKYNISLECNNIFNELAYDNLKLQKPGRSFFCKFRLFLN